MKHKIRLSTKGQIVIPLHARERFGWLAGKDLIADEKEDGLFISRPQGASWEEIQSVSGSLKYDGPAKTIADMNEGIAEAMREKYDRR